MDQTFSKRCAQTILLLAAGSAMAAWLLHRRRQLKTQRALEAAALADAAAKVPPPSFDPKCASKDELLCSAAALPAGTLTPAPSYNVRWHSPRSKMFADLDARTCAFVEAFFVRCRTVEHKSDQVQVPFFIDDLALQRLPGATAQQPMELRWPTSNADSSCVDVYCPISRTITRLERTPPFDGFRPLETLLSFAPPFFACTRDVDPASATFESLACLLAESLGKSTRVARIQMVDNPTLMASFNSQRQRAMTAYERYARWIALYPPAPKEDCEKQQNVMVSEALCAGNVLMYHGTDLCAAASIVEHGFDPTQSGRKHGQALGAGTYFASSPEVAVKYADYFFKGHRVILCCRVVVGSYHSPNHSRRVDMARQYGGILEKSLHARTERTFSPEMFVVESRAQAYPLYVVYLRTLL